MVSSARSQLFLGCGPDDTKGIIVWGIVSSRVTLMLQSSTEASPEGEKRYPPPRTVRITEGRAGSGSILRRMRMIRRSMARSKASAIPGIGQLEQAVAREHPLGIGGEHLEEAVFRGGERMLVAARHRAGPAHRDPAISCRTAHAPGRLARAVPLTATGAVGCDCWPCVLRRRTERMRASSSRSSHGLAR